MRGGETRELREDWTETSCGKIFSRSGGRGLPGVPVVLVHGLVVNSNYMVPLARVLAPLCPVHAVDLPGFGKSCKPRRALGIHELAESLEEWLAAAKLPEVHLFGNSMGCQIIADYALHHPQRIRRIVLQGPTVDCSARTYLRQLWRQAVNLSRDRPSLGVMIAGGMVKMGVPRAFRTSSHALRDRIEDKLPLLPMPVLMVYGDRDPIAPPQWVRDLASLLPHGEIAGIKGGGHTLNYSMPRELVQVMRPFLAI